METFYQHQCSIFVTSSPFDLAMNFWPGPSEIQICSAIYCYHLQCVEHNQFQLRLAVSLYSNLIREYVTKKLKTVSQFSFTVRLCTKLAWIPIYLFFLKKNSKVPKLPQSKLNCLKQKKKKKTLPNLLSSLKLKKPVLSCWKPVP